MEYEHKILVFVKDMIPDVEYEKIVKSINEFLENDKTFLFLPYEKEFGMFIFEIGKETKSINNIYTVKNISNNLEVSELKKENVRKSSMRF